MSSHTAILFLTFNRLDTTQRVFKEIQKAQPPRLYLASDGHRAGIPEEKDKVKSVRDYLLSNITWDCKVQTLFRDKNLGCKYAVSSAIDWFFEHEEMGIILEDDCLPAPSFFSFCETLLLLYKEDTRIAQISGTNIIQEFDSNCSYHFSNFGSIWGWATWKRAWEKYDLSMTTFPALKKRGYLKTVINNPHEYHQRLKAFQDTFNGKINTWDYQWIYARLANRMLSIIPHTNLISNIGFGDNATHTVGLYNPLSNLVRGELREQLIHPELILPSIEFEKRVHIKKVKSAILRRVYLIISSIKRFLWVKK